MELIRLMRRHPVLKYEMKQMVGGDFQLTYQGDIDVGELESELQKLFRETVNVVRAG